MNQCLDCKFYEPLFDEMGSCKRYPFTLSFLFNGGSIKEECEQTVFPVVNERCWCGEYKGKYQKYTGQEQEQMITWKGGL